MTEERKIDIPGMAETRHWGKDKGKDPGGGCIVEQKREEEDTG